MAQRLSATYQDGVFRPDARVSMPDRTRVRITVEAIEAEAPSDHDAAWDTLRVLWATPAIDSAGDRLTRDALHDRR